MILQGLRKLIDQFRITSPNSLLRHTTTENPVYGGASPVYSYRPNYPYGHSDDNGPFLRTALVDEKTIEPHLEALVAATMDHLDERLVVRPADVREGYMNVLFQAHKPLEPLVYEVLQKGISVDRPLSCVSALNRTLAVHSVSGKTLGEVRAMIQNVGREYSVPKPGDI